MFVIIIIIYYIIIIIIILIGTNICAGELNRPKGSTIEGCPLIEVSQYYNILLSRLELVYNVYVHGLVTGKCTILACAY